MSRLKLTAMAALLAIPLAACNEGTPPPPQGSIEGQVSIEGQGVAGVTVSLSNGTSQTTGTDGRFAFAGIDGGTYTVSISGFAADATFSSTSQPATITTQGQTVTVNFAGTYVRTASILGSVTVEGDGQGGLAVRLSGMADASTTTDASGQYTFTGLRAGAYEVVISGFDADAVGFSSTSKRTTVGVGETEVVSFDGTYLRTAGIVGRVSVEGTGLAGVTVSLSGSESRTATTDQAGQYAFNDLRAGTYQVGISGFDADDYEFATTSQSVTVALGRTENVPFDGTLLRTAGISGRVSVEGMALADVTVMLSGASSDSTMTNESGQYAFTGLSAGDYMVAISGYDMDAYNFDAASMSVTLADDESNITNFMGTHSRAANIWGYAYLDADEDDVYDGDDLEDVLAQAGMPVVLQGPGVGDVTTTVTNEMGMYKFDSLAVGTYRVLSATPDSTLARMGLAFGGLQTGTPVVVAPGSHNALHLPFDIKRQRLTVSAMMGDGDKKMGDPVKGVEIMLYPTYADADAGRRELGSSMTDSMGVATFDFMRAADVGPGGTTDFVVFAKAGALPSDDFSVSSNAIQEVLYPARSPVAAAAQTITLLNRRATFSYKVMTVGTDLVEASALEGWATEVRYATGDDGFQSPKTTSKSGMVVHTDAVSASALPVKYYVSVAGDQLNTLDMGESYMDTPMASDDAMMTTDATTKDSYLVYEHDGVALPGDTVYLGQMDVKFTTQRLVVGFHHEVDQRHGYEGASAFSRDQRPSGDARGNISVTLMTLDEQTGNPKQWTYPEGYTGDNRTERSPTATSGGLVTFQNLPTNLYFSVKAEVTNADTLRSREFVSDSDIETYIVDGRLADVLNKGNRGAHSVGAFGPQGGTGPEVRICPLSGSATASDCSTFAYALADGMLSGNTHSAAGSDASGVVVTLTPDAALGQAQVRVDTVKAADAGAYSFDKIVAGVYTVSVAATDDWAPPATGASHKLIFRSTDGGDRDADTEFTRAQDFELTYQKTSIFGTVSNDEGNNNLVSPYETAEGIKLNLRVPTRAGRPGTVVATTTTTSLGQYSFENLAEGRYFIEGVSTSEYDIVARTSGTVPKPEAITTVITTTFEAPTIVRGGQPPRWNPHQSTVDNGGSITGLVHLHKRGSYTVTATAPDDTFEDAQGNGDADSDPDPYPGIPFYLERCLASDFTVWNAVHAACPGATGKTDAAFTSIRGVTNEDGVLIFENLRVGVYRAIPQLAGLDITLAQSAGPTFLVGVDAPARTAPVFNVTVP